MAPSIPQRSERSSLWTLGTAREWNCILEEEREFSFHFLPRVLLSASVSGYPPTQDHTLFLLSPQHPPSQDVPHEAASAPVPFALFGSRARRKPGPLSLLHSLGPQLFAFTQSRSQAPLRLDLVLCRLSNLLNCGYFYSLLEGKKKVSYSQSTVGGSGRHFQALGSSFDWV